VFSVFVFPGAESCVPCFVKNHTHGSVPFILSSK